MRCPLCASGEAGTHLVVSPYTLLRCRRCDLIFEWPRPEPREVERQYFEGYFTSSDPVAGGYEDYLGDRELIETTFRRRLELLERVRAATPSAGRLSGGGASGPARLLDVGCAMGFFLTAARARGWTAQGVDLSPEAVREARRLGLDVREGRFREAALPAGAYDLVTMWDYIEHVVDPLADLREAARVLAPATAGRPGGLVAVSTPDAGSLAARLLRLRWLGYCSPKEHLTYFTRETLSAMLHAAGFETVLATHIGKDLFLSRVVTRLRVTSPLLSRLSAIMVRTLRLERAQVYLNPLDTLLVVARKIA